MTEVALGGIATAIAVAILAATAPVLIILAMFVVLFMLMD